MKKKKIYKYPTGVEIPEGAVYLTTLKQTEDSHGHPVWLVWHYFLVEVEIEVDEEEDDE